MTTRFLSAADVKQVLTPASCIPLMRSAFKAEAEGRTIQPLRQIMAPPNLGGVLGIMPGYVATENTLGIKVVSVFPGNLAKGLSSHQGIIMVMDTDNGTPTALIDAAAITAIRTGAATAAATDALAREDSHSLGLYGYGEQAYQHVLAISAVRPLSRIVVYGRNRDRTKQFVSDCEKLVDGTLVIAPDIRSPAECDIVCTLTAAKQPFFDASWVRPGQHVNLVGSATPDANEAGPEIVRSGRFFVDFVESARNLAGEFVKAKKAGIAENEDILGSIGDVLIGKVNGRRTPEDTTIFKSLGMSAEDLVAAKYAVEEAQRLGIGQVIDFSLEESGVVGARRNE